MQNAKRAIIIVCGKCLRQLRQLFYVCGNCRGNICGKRFFAATAAATCLPQVAAALRQLFCFPGGIVLHCIFISTKHNPADWPSRGDRSTWPADLRRRHWNSTRPQGCPACIVVPTHHPKHLPKRLRGKHGTFRNCCVGPGGGFASNFDTCIWEPYSVLYARHLQSSEGLPRTAKRILEDMLADDIE